MEPQKRACIVVLDGIGVRKEKEYNAVALARTPVLDSLKKEYPYTTLACWGNWVGLPRGFMGGSEVGHLHIGAGRTVPQEMELIDRSIRDGSFFSNPVLLHAMENAKRKGRALHVMGLASDRGVHAHVRHLRALLEMAKKEGVERVFVHAFLDGRDTPPRCAKKYIDRIEKWLEPFEGGIATVSGRYYAMDRDGRWNRTKLAYDAIVRRRGRRAKTPGDAIAIGYARGETDEFVKPTVIESVESSSRDPRVLPGDSVVFYNFRSDRARQLTRAFTDPEFRAFQTEPLPGLVFVGFRKYARDLDNYGVVFPHETVEGTLGEIFSMMGVRQLRVAESEKGAHVTYFFNGGRYEPFPGEDRVIIPSPKVKTYDLKPEMSARGVAREAVRGIESGEYHFVLVNFANGDMVGHTGVLSAAIRAVETVDKCLGEIVEACKREDWTLIVCADHGNSEDMGGPDGPHTSHTLNRVPLILVDSRLKKRPLPRNRGLTCIAPTLLELVGLEVPDYMEEPIIRIE